MTNKKMRVFIYKAYGTTGGAFMLYQLGRVCFEEFNTPVFIVQERVKKKAFEKKGEYKFNYQYSFPIISIKRMKKIIKGNDLFICNPVHSFKSFVSKLKCKKLMYLQGVNTYQNIDMDFNYYVSVSKFVQENTKNKYGIHSSVINPFINLHIFNKVIPWDQRSNEILVLNYKKETSELFKQLTELYNLKYPQNTLKFKFIKNLSQQELATFFGKHKYYLTLTPIEGFGLPSLEAMASGCAVLGFDAYGGREYFESGHNSFVAKYANFNQLVEYLRNIEEDPNIGIRISSNAIAKAQNFSFDQFKQKWVSFLESHVI